MRSVGLANIRSHSSLRWLAPSSLLSAIFWQCWWNLLSWRAHSGLCDGELAILFAPSLVRHGQTKPHVPELSHIPWRSAQRPSHAITISLLTSAAAAGTSECAFPSENKKSRRLTHWRLNSMGCKANQKNNWTLSDVESSSFMGLTNSLTTRQMAWTSEFSIGALRRVYWIQDNQRMTQEWLLRFSRKTVLESFLRNRPASAPDSEKYKWLSRVD